MPRSRLAVAVILAALVLCGTGCGSGIGTTDTNAPAHPFVHDEATGQWSSVVAGVERAVFPVDAAKTMTMELYRFDGSGFTERMEMDVNAKTVSAWAAQIGGEVLVVNGTYFHSDHFPSGFLTVDGVQAGRRMFDQDRSALLQLSPSFGIINTKAQRIDLTPQKFPNAAQSYPLLIADGSPAIAVDSGQKSRRTFVGQDVEGKMYVGVVDDGFVSLRGLTDALVATEVQWQNVLNLDGGTSTGLVSTFGDGESRDSFVGVPNVLVVRRAASDSAAPVSP